MGKTAKFLERSAAGCANSALNMMRRAVQAARSAARDTGRPRVLPGYRGQNAWPVVVCAALLLGQTSSPTVHAQAPQAPATQAPEQSPQQPTFRVSVDLVTTDVIVRDKTNDQFIADLKPGEFEVYEDGVKQEIVSLVL